MLPVFLGETWVDDSAFTGPCCVPCSPLNIPICPELKSLLDESAFPLKASTHVGQNAITTNRPATIVVNTVKYLVLFMAHLSKFRAIQREQLLRDSDAWSSFWIGVMTCPPEWAGLGVTVIEE